MTNTNKRGFTLIEMLVVVAVIAILSGLTLTGIGGFTSRARDTRRIGDLRSIQNYIEAYNSKCGLYPGNTTVCAAAAPTTWANFQTLLNSAISVSVPNDPQTSSNYFYGTVSATDNSKYVVGAHLENVNQSAFNPGSGDKDQAELTAAGIAAFTTGSTAASCADTDASTARGYCLGS